MLDVADSVFRIRVIAEELDRAAFALGLNLFEELDHASRVIAGVMHDLCSYQVSLAFGIAGIFQEERIETKAQTELCQNTADRITPQHSAKNRKRGLRKIRFRNLVGAVPQNNVTDFVCHNAGDLILAIGCCDRSAIDIDKTARQRERVDCRVVHDFELEWILVARRVRCKRLSKRINIGCRLLVIEYGELFLRFFGRLLSHFDVLLGREKIPPGLQFRSGVRRPGGNHERQYQA